MSTHSGLFTFDEARATLTQGTGGVWLGETRSSSVSRLPSGLAATFDGRIDNRDNLLRRLALDSTGFPGDAHLALTVFERWGVDGLRSMVGDWSLAVWDAAARTLHLARDYMGARPLYYGLDARYVAWSTTCRTRDADRAPPRAQRQIRGRVHEPAPSPDTTPQRRARGSARRLCVGQRERPRHAPPFWTIEAGEIRHPDPIVRRERTRSGGRRCGRGCKPAARCGRS